MRTTKIGVLEWTTENLNVRNFRNGAEIPLAIWRYELTRLDFFTRIADAICGIQLYPLHLNLVYSCCYGFDVTDS